MRHIFKAAASFFCITLATATASHAAAQERDVAKIVAETVEPLMAQHGIPGMAVGVIQDGRSAVYNFGVTAKGTDKAVNDRTLFEIGSLSKTFTATLAAYANLQGALSLKDNPGRHLHALKGGDLDRVSLLNLATHTTGGMPLQVPDAVTTEAELMAYFAHWKPSHEPGAWRTYANPSIGLLGMVAASSMKADFAALMKERLYPALGLRDTFLTVPDARMTDYAQGYTKADKPTRMSPGLLAAEAYGVRTTAGDLLRFVSANMGLLKIDPQWRRALIATHTGYFRLGAMTQDLIWEQYALPLDLENLLAGNSAKVSYEGNPVTPIEPPLAPQENVLINKTGSTNGFGAYAAFIPARKAGIVLLANKNYPIEARVTAAYQILARLTGPLQGK